MLVLRLLKDTLGLLFNHFGQSLRVAGFLIALSFPVVLVIVFTARIFSLAVIFQNMRAISYLVLIVGGCWLVGWPWRGVVCIFWIVGADRP